MTSAPRLAAAALALLLGACSRDGSLPPPSAPGTIQGRVVYAVPNQAQPVPASGASVGLLGTGLETSAGADGRFLLGQVTQTSGSLLVQVDLDGDGTADRQLLLDLATLGAGPGRDLALGDVSVLRNATLSGKALLADLSGASGHFGTAVFVPEGPFLTQTGNDGSWILPNMPPGQVTLTFFRSGYDPKGVERITLVSGQEVAVPTVTLPVANSTPRPGLIAGQLTFSPALADASSATLTLSDAAGTQLPALHPTSSGAFRIDPAAAGLYRLEVDATGYDDVALSNLLVPPGQEARVQLQLSRPALPQGCVTGTRCDLSDPCLAGQVTCSSGAPVCSATGKALDGTGCGTNQACLAGLCTALCTPYLPCQAANPCHAGQSTCASGVSACADTGLPQPDGSACGSNLVCSAGTCGPAAGTTPTTRVVSATFQVKYVEDSGLTTTVTGPPPGGGSFGGLLVPDPAAAGGYRRFWAPLAGGSTFTIAGVPTGSYYLQIDRGPFELNAGGTPVQVRHVFLQPYTTDTPDLVLVSSSRPDVAVVSTNTLVTLNLTNMAPWVTGGQILLASSQGAVGHRPIPGTPMVKPLPGDTSFSGIYDWNSTVPNVGGLFSGIAGLPDAARGDVLHVIQRSGASSGSGIGAVRTMLPVRAARLTNVTIPNGGPATINADLTSPVVLATSSWNLRGSQFAALAPRMNPAASVNALAGLNVVASFQASPHSLDYPDMPFEVNALGYIAADDGTVDFDFSPVSYGPMGDSIWKSFRQFLYCYDVSLTAPGAGAPTPLPDSTCYGAWEALPLTAPVVPVIGPPSSPRLNGVDAFLPTASAGLQPVFSWSPPTIGAATSYTIEIRLFDPPVGGELTLISTTVRGTSFTVPPELLIPGRNYYAIIYATAAPWDKVNTGLYRSGLPRYSAPLVTGVFTAG